MDLRPALRVDGRIESARGQQLPPMMPRTRVREPVLRVGAVRRRRPRGSTMCFPPSPRRAVHRPAVETGGWFVESVTLGGKDITDRAFDLQADTTSLVVTYTNRPSKVSGTVKDTAAASRVRPRW